MVYRSRSAHGPWYPRLTAAVMACAAAVLIGCASAPVKRASTDPAEWCETEIARVDALVDAAGVRDAEATRVAGFPTLRVDRFLASFRYDLADADLRAWTGALLRLDREARAVEIANLPATAREQLPSAADASLLDRITTCGEVLRDRDLASPARRAALREAAVVPDDYAMEQRVFGLYALTRIPFAFGVRLYEADVHRTFATPLAALPSVGRQERYALSPSAPSGVDPRPLVARVQKAGAAFRVPDAADARQLLVAYAPVIEVDEASPDDRIGTIRLNSAGRAEVATDAASIYGRIAFTRFGGRVRVQAVYTVWFPARPRTGVLDLLGGDFDALVWRVTLDDDGAPLVFDTMHACGCYHMFVPTARVTSRARPDRASLDEQALIAQTLPVLDGRAPVRLRVASRTHALVRVQTGAGGREDDAAHSLTLRPEEGLRSLAAPGGTRRSLYGPDGIVAGSERAERLLFWPMGVRSPGAMRQWGRHATAFVGRRHFDDVDLLDRYFTPDGGSNGTDQRAGADQ